MPFQSQKQRRYMFSQHSDIARRWEAEGKAYVKGGKMKKLKFPAQGRDMKKILKKASTVAYKGRKMMMTPKEMKPMMKRKMTQAQDTASDRRAGRVEGSKADIAQDRRNGIKDKKRKQPMDTMIEKKKKKNWIAGAIKHPGALHRQMGVKQGSKIPAGRLAAAANKPGVLGRRARLAETLKGMHHKTSKTKK